MHSAQRAPSKVVGDIALGDTIESVQGRHFLLAESAREIAAIILSLLQLDYVSPSQGRRMKLHQSLSNYVRRGHRNDELAPRAPIRFLLLQDFAGKVPGQKQ